MRQDGEVRAPLLPFGHLHLANGTSRYSDGLLAVTDLLKVQPNSSLSRSRRSHYRDAEMFGVYIDALRQAGLPE